MFVVQLPAGTVAVRTFQGADIDAGSRRKTDPHLKLSSKSPSFYKVFAWLKEYAYILVYKTSDSSKVIRSFGIW